MGGFFLDSLVVGILALVILALIGIGLVLYFVALYNGLVGLQGRITELEETIADRREFYNDSVNTYNIRIQQLPDAFIARMMNLQPHELFKVSEEERRDVEVKLT